MKKTMKKQTKKPAAKTATKPTAVPVSKTVARVLAPAVTPQTDPEEARIHREAAAAGDEARRHVRRAELYRLKSGTPYAGEDEQLVGSTFHDRDALDQFGALAEEEEAKAERCFERLRRAHEELKDLRDRKAQQEHAAALREHAAALRASNTPPPSSSPTDTAASGRPAEIVQEEAVRDWWVATPERPRGNKKRLDSFREWVNRKWMPRTDANTIRRSVDPKFFAMLCERFRKTPPTAK